MPIHVPKYTANEITPLAAKMRPNSIDDVLGQDHLLGDGMPLRQMAKQKIFQSTILWGPSGVGKTSIVRALSHETDSIFCQLNATNASVKDLRKIISDAQVALNDGYRTFVFVDEIHRWNKSQQDTMLPSVEDGTIVLFGATTENPKFAVNSTLLSRCLSFEVKPLDNKAMVKLISGIKKYYKNQDRKIDFDREAIKILINRCNGDARKLVSSVETVIEILSDENFVSVDSVNIVLPHKHLSFDANGNEHFDYAHCYQEAIQHSEVDDAIYWLAKWIASGEDPAYICRRMLITAFEDCAGNPYAVTTTMAAAFTTERTGLPECAIAMALATCEMATSERNKSAYNAIQEAMCDVNSGESIHVPPSLRAGTTGYSKMVNKKYLKGWIKDWDKRAGTQTEHEDISVYATTLEAGGSGFINGPTPCIDDLLKFDGSDGEYIVKCNGDEEDEIMFSWDSDLHIWM